MELKEKIKTLPQSPGIYLMKDSYGHIIYVGKSKSLKSRVSSYFHRSVNHSPKVERMVKHLKDFDYILTDTEFEALMLECQYIQQYQPLYNRMMKNTQSYVYFVISMENERCELKWSKQMEEDGNRYFGPFASRGMAERAIQGLKEFYKIDCSNTGRGSSPCLNYSIGKCMGICFKEEAREKYQQIVNKLVAFFERKDHSIVKTIEEAMMEAAAEFQFEKAANLRNLITAIQSLLKREKAIEFAEQNKNFVVGELLGEGKIKFFHIYRNEIIFRDIYDLLADKEEIIASLKDKIIANFQKGETNRHLKKDELDKAQIIYNYLQSSSCRYIEIDENDITNEKLLTNKIKKFIGLRGEKWFN